MTKPHIEMRSGGCHCGAVAFEVRAHLESGVLCNCSICSKKGFVHWLVTREEFTLLRGQDSLTTYTFNTGVARHLFCKTCGISAFYVPRSHPDGYSVNLRCVDGVDLARLPLRGFDGQHWEQARASL